jgi:hypothetical protein
MPCKTVQACQEFLFPFLGTWPPTNQLSGLSIGLDFGEKQRNHSDPGLQDGQTGGGECLYDAE